MSLSYRAEKFLNQIEFSENKTKNFWYVVPPDDVLNLNKSRLEIFVHKCEGILHKMTVDSMEYIFPKQFFWSFQNYH